MDSELIVKLLILPFNLQLIWHPYATLDK